MLRKICCCLGTPLINGLSRVISLYESFSLFRKKATINSLVTSFNFRISLEKKLLDS